MAKRPEMFAVFCWTHKGMDRQRIRCDEAPAVACKLSVTIRAQYEGAKNKAEQQGGVLVKAFFFEEKAHEATADIADALRMAMDWCSQEGATLIINDLSDYRGRGFRLYRWLISEKRIRYNDIDFVEAEPSQRHVEFDGRPVSLEVYFDMNRKREKALRIKMKRNRGLLHAIRHGAKVGFAAGWTGKISAAKKGRDSQQSQASLHAQRLIKVINAIRRARPNVSLPEMAEILNEKALYYPDYRPARAEKWTPDNLRMLMRREDLRRSAKLIGSPQPS